MLSIYILNILTFTHTYTNAAAHTHMLCLTPMPGDDTHLSKLHSLLVIIANDHKMPTTKVLTEVYT